MTETMRNHLPVLSGDTIILNGYMIFSCRLCSGADELYRSSEEVASLSLPVPKTVPKYGVRIPTVGGGIVGLHTQNCLFLGFVGIPKITSTKCRRVHSL